MTVSLLVQTIEHLFAHENFRFDEVDICESPLLQEAVNWSDYIYHMAAVVGMQKVLKVPADTMSNNVLSLEVVLKAMAKGNRKTRLVIASSSGVYWQINLQKEINTKKMLCFLSPLATSFKSLIA